MLTIPAAWAGVTAVILVELTTEKLAADVPANLTCVAPVKFVPVMVTVLPPLVGPPLGTTKVIVGARPAEAP